MHAGGKNSSRKWIIGGLCDYRLFDLRGEVGRLILMEFYSPGQRAASSSQIPLLRSREDNRKVPLWARYSDGLLA